MKKIKNIIKNKIKRIIDWFDPYHQSFLFLPWGFWSIIIVCSLCMWLTWHWNTGWVDSLRGGVFTYLPTYLIHEMLGHNFVGSILYHIFYPHPLGQWLDYLAGNGVEILVPLCLYFWALRLQGGRWLTPLLFYWLSVALVGTGRYAYDATACSLPLTSSDMMTNYKAGSGVCGDWHFILEPLGLLPYDHAIAMVFISLGMFCLLMAVWSLWCYIFHAEEDLKNAPKNEF